MDSSVQFLINNNEKRLRSFYRVLIQIVLLIGASLLTYEIPMLSKNALLQNAIDEFVFLIFGGITVLFAALVLDRRNILSIGLNFNKKSLSHFLLGFLFTLIGISSLFAVGVAAGFYELTGYMLNKTSYPAFGAYLISFTGYVSVALIEESFSRGYHIKNISEGFHNGNNARKSVIFGVLISSIIFGGLHSLNPNLSWFGVFNIVLIGLMFAYMYLKTGSLAMPIGSHLAWNFSLGHIFGLPVSGFNTNLSIFSIELNASDLITGGKFGPEGGVAIYLTIAVTFLLTYLFFGKNKVNYKEIAFYKSGE